MADTRITVPLSLDEWEALKQTALQEYRNPRDQARYILREALLQGNQPQQEKSQGGGQREKVAA